MLLLVFGLGPDQPVAEDEGEWGPVQEHGEQLAEEAGVEGVQNQWEASVPHEQ